MLHFWSSQKRRVGDTLSTLRFVARLAPNLPYRLGKERQTFHLSQPYKVRVPVRPLLGAQGYLYSGHRGLESGRKY